MSAWNVWQWTGWIMFVLGVGISIVWILTRHHHRWGPWGEGFYSPQGNLQQIRTCKVQSCHRQQARWCQ